MGGPGSSHFIPRGKHINELKWDKPITSWATKNKLVLVSNGPCGPKGQLGPYFNIIVLILQKVVMDKSYIT